MKITKSIIALLLLSILGVSAFSQSKKTQIERLAFKVDSLNKIISNERLSNSEISIVLNDNIKTSQRKIDSLITQKNLLEAEVIVKSKEIERLHISLIQETESLKFELNNKITENNKLRTENSKIHDSLLIIKESLLKSTLNGEPFDDCWKNVPLVDTLTFSNNKQIFITPIDSSEFLLGSNCQKLTFIVDKQTIANKKFVKCFFRNGTSKTFYNDLGPDNDEYYDSYLQFIYKGSVKEIDYYLIERINAEWSTFLLVDKENGNEIEVCAEPVLSNNKKYLISSKTSAIQEELFQILNVRQNGKVVSIDFKYFTYWQIDSIKFKGTQELLIRKSIDSCSKYKYGKLILD